MKAALLALVLAGVFAGAAQAETCSQIAANCLKQGGTRDRCHGPALAECQKTGTYVGSYSGKTFTAGGPSGACPAGTCAQDGGPQAKDIKNCRASNCRK
jgi:opacity protein-like surface antigen